MRGFPKVHLEQIEIGRYTKEVVDIMLRIAADRWYSGMTLRRTVELLPRQSQNSAVSEGLLVTRNFATSGGNDRPFLILTRISSLGSNISVCNKGVIYVVFQQILIM